MRGQHGQPGLRPVATILAPIGGGPLYVVVAFAVHAGLFAAASAASVGHDSEPPPKRSEVAFVEVKLEQPKPPPPPPKIEPPKPEEPTIEEPEPELAKPEEAPKPVEPQPRAEAPKPKAKQEAPKPDAPPSDPNQPVDFADFGAFAGSTSGNGSVAVSVGSSAAGSLSSGGVERPREPKQQKPAEAAPAPAPVEEAKPEVVARKKLSRQASPDESYNRKIKAVYPAELKNQGLEADVVALVTVRADGSVASVEVVNDVDRAFADAAIAAIKKFRFEPAIKDDKPVASEIRVVYKFRLDEA